MGKASKSGPMGAFMKDSGKKIRLMVWVDSSMPTETCNKINFSPF